MLIELTLTITFELTNAIDILDTMEVGVYGIVETQWDTTYPKFCKMM